MNINKNLSTLKCEPCSGNTPKMNYEQIIDNLSKINDNSLTKAIFMSL